MKNRREREHMSFFNNLNDKMMNFMVGRNGVDKLARWCLGGAVVLTIVNMIVPNIFLMLLSYLLLFYCLFRTFSKNVSARQAENEKFENLFSRTKSKTTSAKTKFEHRKTTVYFKCEECGQSLSVPKGKGKLKVTCPKCSHQTTIKS